MIIYNNVEYKKRFMVAIPMTGLVRAEWMMARYGQAVPCNWSMVEHCVWLDSLIPLGFGIADARNISVEKAIEDGSEWMFFLDSDVIIPAGTLIKLNNHMVNHTAPIINGVYFTKSTPSEPVIYRGRGNGYFADWTLGDQVWVDGAGMGVTLIHMSVLKAVYDDSEPYYAGSTKCRRVFGNPESNHTPEGKENSFVVHTGTEDLPFYTKVHEGGYYEKAGWPDIQKKKYPILADTSIMCKHITPGGVKYPMYDEALRFMNKDQVAQIVANSRG